MSRITIREKGGPLRGDINVYDVSGLRPATIARLRRRGYLKPVWSEHNVILQAFTDAFHARLTGAPTARDLLQLCFQGLGTGTTAEVETDENLEAETYRKSFDSIISAGNQVIMITTFSSLEANCAQGRITTNFSGSGTDSTTTWTMAPDVTGLSPQERAYVETYFKRARVGDLFRFGLGAGNTTYEFRTLTGVVYNAAATSCVITITDPLPSAPPQNATADQCMNEVGVVGDFPTIQAMTGVPTLTTFDCADIRYFFAGDKIRHFRADAVSISGASFDLQQFAVVASTTPGVGNAGTVTLVAPGWAVDYTIPGSAPAPTPVAGIAGDFVYGGRYYNRVAGIRFVKSRAVTLMVETIFTTAS